MGPSGKASSGGSGVTSFCLGGQIFTLCVCAHHIKHILDKGCIGSESLFPNGNQETVLNRSDGKMSV